MFDLPAAHLAITLVRREFEAETIRPRRPSRLVSRARAAAAAVLAGIRQERPAKRTMAVGWPLAQPTRGRGGQESHFPAL
ncbi:hypothetical protein [Pseudonocardia sp. TRM90224]|uniref:hypothetical protein n=1 Tax=Pseudonocardia sp. TRM90224 TaxID=2812678 RepID=UPI001E2CB65C|nr:hypothetical protein [Pseudonocardia sp. TRM90224]